MIEVVPYSTEEGKVPFDDWFDKLNIQAVAKVTSAIARIEGGNFGDVKSVGKGVFERRLKFRPGYRIYFGQDEDKVVILLIGGTKKHQSKDIQKAQLYWSDYIKRNKEVDDDIHSQF